MKKYKCVMIISLFTNLIQIIQYYKGTSEREKYIKNTLIKHIEHDNIYIYIYIYIYTYYTIII